MRVVQKKICLLGDFAVGKTSLVRRFVEDRFDDKYLSTIGVKVSRKKLTRPEHELQLLVWDLVGGSDFSRRELGYLVGAVGAIIVCDLTREDTLGALTFYTRQMRVVNPNAALIYAANKVDLVDARRITETALLDVSQTLGGEYLLTSAKTGEQVELAFMKLAERIDAGQE